MLKHYYSQQQNLDTGGHSTEENLLTIQVEPGYRGVHSHYISRTWIQRKTYSLYRQSQNQDTDENLLPIHYTVRTWIHRRTYSLYRQNQNLDTDENLLPIHNTVRTWIQMRIYCLYRQNQNQDTEENLLTKQVEPEPGYR